MEKLQKDLTDADIDNLFNNNDTSVLKDTIEQKDIIPQELSTENKEKANHIDRPPEKIDSEKTRIRKEISKIDEGVLKIRKLISDLKKYKQQSNSEGALTRAILNGNTKVNVDPSTQCTFHIYQPKDIKHDKITCSCKFCSAMKDFTQSEWDEYCVKYRKWF